jgi:DNA-binding NtrC family response regulator
MCKKMENGYSLRNWEKTVIEAALSASNNFVPMAADMLEIGKSTLYRKLKEYNINQ